VINGDAADTGESEPFAIEPDVDPHDDSRLTDLDVLRRIVQRFAVVSMALSLVVK
jgi:hypothetical protein